MTKCLFIGGPVDGKYLDVDECVSVIEVALPSEPLVISGGLLPTKPVTVETISYWNRVVFYKELPWKSGKYSHVFVKEGIKVGFG